MQEDVYQEKRNEIFHYSIFQPDGYAVERQGDAIAKLLTQHETTSYRWFRLKCAVRNFWRNLYLNIVLKRKVDKLAGLE